MKVELISREVQSAPPQMQADDARWSWDTLNNHYRDLLQIYNRTLNGYIVNIADVTTSPYDILESDDDIFADTDAGDVVVNLPAGAEGKKYRIINVGTSGNIVTLNPDGTDNLIGENSSITIDDSEAVIVSYSISKGWY